MGVRCTRVAARVCARANSACDGSRQSSTDSGRVYIGKHKVPAVRRPCARSRLNFLPRPHPAQSIPPPPDRRPSQTQSTPHHHPLWLAHPPFCVRLHPNLISACVVCVLFVLCERASIGYCQLPSVLSRVSVWRPVMFVLSTCRVWFCLSSTTTTRAAAWRESYTEKTSSWHPPNASVRHKRSTGLVMVWSTFSICFLYRWFGGGGFRLVDIVIKMCLVKNERSFAFRSLRICWVTILWRGIQKQLSRNINEWPSHSPTLYRR